MGRYKDVANQLRPRDRKKFKGLVKALMKSKKKGKPVSLKMKGTTKR